jgi:hypothetical protein
VSDIQQPRPVIPASKIDKFLGLKRSQRETLIQRGVLPVFRWPGGRARFVYVDDLVKFQQTAEPATPAAPAKTLEAKRRKAKAAAGEAA